MKVIQSSLVVFTFSSLISILFLSNSFVEEFCPTSTTSKTIRKDVITFDMIILCFYCLQEVDS